MKTNTGKKNVRKKGFTLVEMLIVIAIIAILVSVLIPTVTGAVVKAKAAADGANLRSLAAVINIAYLDNSKTNAEFAATQSAQDCKLFKNAETYVAFAKFGFDSVYFVDGENAYGVDYFAEVSVNGVSDKAKKLIKNTQELLETYGVGNFVRLTEKAG